MHVDSPGLSGTATQMLPSLRPCHRHVSQLLFRLLIHGRGLSCPAPPAQICTLIMPGITFTRADVAYRFP